MWLSSSEMKWAFTQKSDHADSSADRAFEDHEIDYYLNNAQLNLVNTYFRGKNQLRDAFESNQYVSDLMNSLIDTQELSHVNNVVTAPSDYMFYVYSYVTSTNCTGSFETDLIEHNQRKLIINDAYRGPSLKWKRAILTQEGSTNQSTTFTVHTNGLYVVDKLFLTYLRKPTKISQGGYNDINGNPVAAQDCLLPDSTHEKIVDLAVQLALVAIKDAESAQLQQVNINNN